MNANVNEVKAVNEVNEVNIKNLKHELFETRSSMGYADVELDKAETILRRWVQDYDFAKKPDPRAAVAYQNGTDNSREAKQASEWCWDYNHIFTIVDIAFDYILEAKKILNKAIEKEV